jgi:hypothetical protein
MKCVKIGTELEINECVEDIKIHDHSIIGILSHKEIKDRPKSASLYNVLSVADSKEIIGLKTTFQLDSEEDEEYIRSSGFNIANMEKEIKDRAHNIIASIPTDHLWYSDLCPIEMNGSSDEGEFVTIVGYRTEGKKVSKTNIILPIAVYIFLSKLKSDIITYIPINPYYTFTDDVFKYEIKSFDTMEYLGSENTGSDEDGGTNVVSMYHLTGKDGIELYVTMPFTTYDKVSINKNLTLKEFSEKHDKFFIFNPTAFVFLELVDGTSTPGFLVYETDKKTFTLYKITEDIAAKLCYADSEVISK